MKVRVEAPLRATEVPGRVTAACTAWWPEARIDARPDRVVAEAQGPTVLDAFRARVWELRIIDTVRGRLLAGADGPTLRFVLDKQAAFAGRVSFPPAPHPLGDVEVTFIVEAGDAWDDAEALAWWLCPETRDGEIVGPAQ